MKTLGFVATLFVCLAAHAQDPTGVLEGQVLDPSSAGVPQAVVTARNPRTGFSAAQPSAKDGSFHFAFLPVGDYELSVAAPGFAPFRAAQVHLDINRTVRIPVRLEIASGRSEVSVTADGATVELGTTLGNVVSGQEATDLPLNGRNFTQLGLLQPGVAPMTAGLAESGGALRGGQAYAVNGQRPESNGYVLDGVSNVNSVDGGFALRTPVDAISEFRILTSNAPAEYGGTSGATTTVVTRSGGNEFHGAVYEFLRNNNLDARNFFAPTTEPLHQNQFGATLGGPLRKNKDFFFGFYEGLRDREGETKTAIVPTPEQRRGDFSGLTDPQTGQPVPLINYFAGGPVPGNQLPAYMLSPVSAKNLPYYPLGNLSPSLYSSTQMLTNNGDQGGLRLDHYFGNGDQLFARSATSSTHSIDPLSISGADVPGFPVGNDGRTHSIALSHTHLFSPRTVQTVKAAFFRNIFLFGQRLNQTDPATLGFDYKPTLGIAAGPPYLIVSGYASVGDPITGPRNTIQNTYQGSYSLSHNAGRHGFKVGAEFTRNQVNLVFGIATNGFFVFAPFPFSDSFASFLTGQSVTFFQGGGQFDRGLRNYMAAGYAQDEWRLTPRLTLNYGLRYEVNTPYTEIRNRLNEWAPGRQSTVYADAPVGLLFPGDRGRSERNRAGLSQGCDAARRPRVGSDRRRQNDRARGVWHLLRFVHERRGRPAASAGQRLTLDAGRAGLRSRLRHRKPVGQRGRSVRREYIRAARHRADRGPGHASALRAGLERLHPTRDCSQLSTGRALRRQQGHAPAAPGRSESARVWARLDSSKHRPAAYLRGLSGCRRGLRLRFGGTDQQRSELHLPCAAGGVFAAAFRAGSASSRPIGTRRAWMASRRSTSPARLRAWSRARTTWRKTPSTWPPNTARRFSTHASGWRSAQATSCRNGAGRPRPLRFS